MDDGQVSLFVEISETTAWLADLSESYTLFRHHRFQGSPFIMLCLGSVQPDRVISEPYYKGIILKRNYRKMTIWEPRPGHVTTKTVL